MEAGPDDERPGSRPAQYAPDRGDSDETTEIGLRRRGRDWELSWGTRCTTIRHGVGVGYLAALIASPGQEIRAVDLAHGPAAPPGDRTPQSRQPMLDRAARRAYRQRLAALDEEIRKSGAGGRVEELRQERKWIEGELSAATGLSGQARDFATSEERARISVTRAIRRALDRVDAADPAVGRLLRCRIRTGSRCSYRAAFGHPSATALSRSRLAYGLSLRGETGLAIRREGRSWHISLGSRHALVAHTVGMSYLEHLLAHPGYAVSAMDLAALPRIGLAAPEFDGRTREVLRRRLRNLDAEIEEHEANNDLVRARRAGDGRQRLIARLLEAGIVADRREWPAGAAEHTRTSVGKALRRAVKRVATVDPVIARELDATIETGRRCCYRPIRQAAGGQDRSATT